MALGAASNWQYRHGLVGIGINWPYGHVMRGQRYWPRYEGSPAAAEIPVRARVSEVLALRALDVDLDAGAVRIRKLKRRVEHRRVVPIPPAHARDLETVHRLREASPRRVKELLWKLSRATAHRKVVAVMRAADIEGPQACPKGLRYGFGIAAVLGHADIATTAIYTTAVGVEARGFLRRCGSEGAI